MAISVPLERNIAYTQTLVTGQGFMRSAVSFLIEGHGSYRQSPLGTKTVAVSFLVLLIELTQLTLFPVICAKPGLQTSDSGAFITMDKTIPSKEGLLWRMNRRFR